MNEQDKQISSLVINSLSDKLSQEATKASTFEALYATNAMELEQIKKIIESDEELKSKFEQVKGNINGSK